MKKVIIALRTGDLGDSPRINESDLSLEDYIGIYENKASLERLIEHAEAEVLIATHEGKNTGYVVGYKEPNSKVVDESGLVKLMKKLGVDSENLYKQNLVSIANLKKLSGLKPKEFDSAFSSCIGKSGEVKTILIKKEEEK